MKSTRFDDIKGGLRISLTHRRGDREPDVATVAELEARLEALKAQRDSAVARVSYDGRSVEYRGTAEIARAIAELERELQALQGKASVRQVRIYTSKGL